MDGRPFDPHFDPRPARGNTMTSTHGLRRMRHFAVVLIAALTLALAPVAVQADVIPGTPGSDNLEGTENPDVIEGDPEPDPFAPTVGADDTINGNGGDDLIRGDANASQGLTGGTDTIDGGEGNDTIQGDGETEEGILDGGDDIINGGAGNDTIDGDGLNITEALLGGHDTINGGAGDDIINGDGFAFNNVLTGGNDTISGGEGNDTIHGDGAEPEDGTVNGGSDQLFGEAGGDTLFGDGGDDALVGGTGVDTLDGGDGIDFLCGSEFFSGTNVEADVLTGGADPDIACVHHDEATVSSGEQRVLDVTTNDEHLADEADEDIALIYEIVEVSEGIEAIIDAVTGILTFTATQSGTVLYQTRRPLSLEDPDNLWISTSALVFITVLEEEDPDDDEDDDDGDEDSDDDEESDDSDGDSSDEAAALPDTGSPASLNAIGALGIALLLGGIGTTVATRPRGRHARI